MKILMLDSGPVKTCVGINAATMMHAGHQVLQLDPSSADLNAALAGSRFDLLWANELGRLEERQIERMVKACRASVLYCRESYFALGAQAALRRAKPLFAHFTAVVTARIRTVADLTSHGARLVFLVWPSTDVSPSHTAEIELRRRSFFSVGRKTAHVELIVARGAALSSVRYRVLDAAVENLAAERFEEMAWDARNSILLAVGDETQLNDTDLLLPWILASNLPVFAHRSFGQEELLGPEFPFFFDDCDGIAELYRREVWPSWSPNETLLRAISGAAQFNAIVDGILP